ncbi:MAG: hypothetical protein Fur0027_14360 [Raineya sp.]
MSYNFETERNPRPITYARACLCMTYAKAKEILAYWRQYNFKGRVKTNEVLAAENYLKNPFAFLRKHKGLDCAYTELSRVKNNLTLKP